MSLSRKKLELTLVGITLIIAAFVLGNNFLDNLLFAGCYDYNYGCQKSAFATLQAFLSIVLLLAGIWITMQSLRRKL